jgi:hypothetical protein
LTGPADPISTRRRAYAMTMVVAGVVLAVRDSKDPGKTPHVFNRHEWECFLIGARNGEFDLPG